MSHLDDRLGAYVDGELGHEAREKVLAHLAECAECREEAEEQRQVKQLLGKVPQPGPSGDLMARLLALGEPTRDQPPPPAAGDRFTFPTAGRPTASARARSRSRGPRAGRPGNMPERVRPPVNRRRLTFAAAGAFSMMAVALSSAFVPGGTSGGTEGRPAAPAVERYLVEQAATTTPLPAGAGSRRPGLVLAGTPLTVPIQEIDYAR
ncbi:zf-HC2 domain-containing protein [Embleya sp. NBC_00896]|uniref:zf-HC2 domain-containing protein n=1 Tax=Embleya sp. NBC_00896 TaxID=2975961 RepID=UPI0038680881|nr:zf-HC2 domain-containing protein [Embleya sp. NBC_00896]